MLLAEDEVDHTMMMMVMRMGALHSDTGQKEAEESARNTVWNGHDDIIIITPKL